VVGTSVAGLHLERDMAAMDLGIAAAGYVL
jgi:hypothetical protein